MKGPVKIPRELTGTGLTLLPALIAVFAYRYAPLKAQLFLKNDPICKRHRKICPLFVVRGVNPGQQTIFLRPMTRN